MLGHVVPLRVGDESTWTMIELQGVLESTTGQLEGQELGLFRVAEGGKDATLTVGSHELQGKLVTLPQPLVATRKGEDGAVVVVGIVRSKYVFKTRPTTVRR